MAGPIGGGGMLLLKVPRWLSEVWMSSPQEAVVADLDLERGRLSVLRDVGRGRPSTFSVVRRASPELFAFPAGGEGEDVGVEGGIAEALSVAADLQDTAYQQLLQQRLATTSTTGGSRSLLERRIIPMNRGDLLAAEAAAAGESALSRLAEAPADTPESEEQIWQAVRLSLRGRPQGVTVEELLDHIPAASGFLAVRNALAAYAEPVEDGSGLRRFVARRRGLPGGPAAAPVAAPEPPPGAKRPRMGPRDARVAA